MKKIVNVAGYGNSGKTAISDFLKEFKPVFSFNNNIEFELFRIPDGILDLYYSLYEDYGLIRSDFAIKRFKRLARRIGTNQKISNPLSYFTASAYNYDQLFKNQFQLLADQYINELIRFSYTTYWPYKNNYTSFAELFFNKTLRKLNIAKDKSEVYFTNKEVFIESTRNFIQNLFDTVTDDYHSIILLNNSFDSYNPLTCHKIVGKGYSIIVERDPRDIYSSVISTSNIYVPEFEKYKKSQWVKKQMIGDSNVDSFIQRYKAIRENASYMSDVSILRIRFEDFVLDFDNSSKKIIEFLDLNEIDWLEKTKKFDPQKSCKNIGLWKKYNHLEEIMKIESQLSEYCYQTA